jgi:drug/metabolite transporter (DMT)-like permease
VSQVVVVVTALASALAAATSSVLQHRSARQAPHDETHRLLGLLLTLPTWLAGLVAALAGLVLHAIALAHGQLTLVQPLLISGMLFALPVSSVLEGRRPSGVEYLWALVLVAGLSAFLVAARPARAQVALDADVLAWATLITVGAFGLVALVGVRWPHGHGPALLGLAAGIGYGVTAALLKQTAVLAQTGIGQLLADWPLYVFIAVGGASIGLTQLAYRAGPLAHSMPALSVSDPAASVALGALAFREHLATGVLSVLFEVIGFAVMAGAATQLARRTKAADREPADGPLG